MRNILFFLSTIFLLSSNLFFAQNDINFGPMDKEQGNMSREEIDDSQESFSLPIFTIKSGGITYPIKLYYNMSGIGVDDVASDVGLGWTLSESFIQRETKDKIDVDETEGGTFPAWSASGYEGQNFATYPLYNIGNLIKKGYQQVKNNGIIEHYNTNIGQLDHEPDIFNMYSPNFMTAFYYPNSLNSPKELYNNDSEITQEIGDVVLDFTNRKFSQGYIEKGVNRIFKDYKKFIVKQNNGIVSTFGQANYIYTANFVRYDGGTATNINYQYSPNAFDGFTVPTAEKWLVSRIYNPRTNREINFTYDTYSTEDSRLIYHPDYVTRNKPYFRDGLHFIYNYNLASNSFFTDDCYIFHDVGVDDKKMMYGKVYKNYIKKKRITKIEFDSGKILFKYDLNREDFHNGKALTRIEIWNMENQLVNSYDFIYGYFESEQYRNEYSKRLKLLSVTQKDGRKHSFEYYESNKMPQIGSYNKDFYGYCNTSNDDYINPTDTNAINYPIYYYYPDKYEFSLMPYNINNQNKFLIEGVINKEPNEMAKTWSLKKVKYPTGGYIEYDLETNVFNLLNENLKGPGVRIKSKTIYESSNSTPRIISYNYNLGNGKSSGSIYNFPLAGYPVKKLFGSYEDDYGNIISAASSYTGETNLYKSFLLFQALTKGKAEVKYSFIQKVEGDKRVDFEFEIQSNNSKRHFRDFYQGNGINDFFPHCISEFLYTNSGVGKDNSNFILSFLTKKRLYNVANLVQENEYQYMNVFNSTATTAYHYFINHYVRNSNTSFDIFPRWNYENLIISDKQYFTRSNYLNKETKKDYFNSNNITTTKSYFYRNSVSGKSLMLEGIDISDGTDNYSTELYHPTNQHVNLVNANILDVILGIRKTKNNIIISHNITDYNNGLFPAYEFITSPVQQNTKEGKISYDFYDDKGNLVGYKNSNEVPVSIIYGYNQTLPIAILEGISYSALLQEIYYTHTGTPASDINDLNIVKLSNLDVDTPSEQKLIKALDKFRVDSMFDGYQCKITTYTYNTLVGVTSVTPPSGIREIRTYDNSNKLEKVVDGNGKLLNEYKYNYKQ